MSSPKSTTLIDRDELLATLEQDIDVSVTGEENMKAVQRCLQEILDDVKESPVVDAVPVVRCKDCKWGRETCGNIECCCDINVPPEYYGYYWFCPNGERKEHETD